MSEYHVASFIVRTTSPHLSAICAQIEQLPGAETHGQNHKGAIIVTLEGANHREIANLTEQIRSIPGIVDIAAVYHEYAPAN